MSRRNTKYLLLLAATLLAGCHKGRPPALASAPVDQGGSSTTKAPRSSADTIDAGPDVRAMTNEGTAASDFTTSDASGEGGPLADVRFELDRATLTDEARGILEKHALWLQGHRDAKVTVEGHCDERGTVDYNLALGEQRARVVRDYLVSLGVATGRLKTVSFGKERPLDPANNEAAWAKNRRAHFAVSR
jgi:peptidoglycan-associated lipoprotein